ncbi:nucleotide exchange factor GrpE [Thiobacter sp. AK1]|uniref:Protein GrpE n=1 Tax=Thiobacter aerophilum TaxID=3121275 RepID=A0ABV0EGX2_9BURK
MEEPMSDQETSQNQTETIQNQPSDHHAPEVMPSLEELLREAERKAQEHYDAWMYAKAETENVRRRSVEEVEKARKFAIESFARELLPVKDALEMALAVENATLESLRQGVELTLKQLTSVFDKFHIQEVNPAGEKFDPNLHDAMAMVESEQEPNTVTQVMQKGYQLHERLLRPALVTVAKAKQG